MKRVLGTIGLALGLAISVIPGYAQSFQEFRAEQTVINPPRVLDTWMQPTYVRTTQVTDENGDAHMRQEPMVWERHERVMMPTTTNETVTVVHKQPEVTVQRTNFAAHVSTKRSSSCVSHRPLRRHFASNPRPRTIAYRSNVASSSSQNSSSSTTSSSTMVEQHQRSVDQPFVFERRDPALDQY